VQNRPDRPFTPKKVADARTEFLARKTKVSARRHRTLSSYLNTFTGQFGERFLHKITPVELRDFVDGREWKPKTHNDFLSDVGLLYKDAQFRNQIPAGCNPARAVERRTIARSTIGVFEPWECRDILNEIDNELVPFLAMWFFSGARKEEISRLSWQQVLRGLETGFIYLEAEQTKTRQPRSVPMQDNLKLWLRTWLLRNSRVSGQVLPASWIGIQRLDELPRFISRNCGVVWRDNAPRHSYASYFFRMCKDAGTVVKSMGTSLDKFEKHYWCKAESITDEAAREWFGIVPPKDWKNIAPMPAKIATNQETASAAAANA